MKSSPRLFRNVLLLVLAFVQPVLADAVFSDGDFNPTDWDVFSFVSDDPRFDDPAPSQPTGSVTQVLTGGNPGSYFESSHRIVGGALITTGAIMQDTVYDPRSDGSIEFIDFSIDLRNGVNGSTAAMLVLEQDGIRYYQSSWAAFSATSWNRYRGLKLRAADFKVDLSDGTANHGNSSLKPDFSKNGSPIRFGYALSNGLNGSLGGVINRKHGVDNWDVKVVTAPPRATGAYINLGLQQRSMIQGIGITFDRDVSGIIHSSTLKARNIGTGQVYDLSGAALVSDPKNLSVTWMLDKNPATLLPDGNYIAWLETDQLVDASSIGKYSASHVGLDDFTFGFHQLAGDSDGDRDVDFLDTAILRDTLQKSLGQNGFKSQLDFDLNDSVVEPDMERVKSTYFTVLPAVPALHAYLRTDDGESQTDNRSSVHDVGIGIVHRAGFERLEARIDGRTFVDVTGLIVSEDKAIFSESDVNSLAGGTLASGPHQIEVRALHAQGMAVATELLAFEKLVVTNQAPYFISAPVTGALTRLVDQPAAVDLTKWSVVPFLFPAAGFGQPDWVLEEGNTVARQRVNLTASILLSDFESANSTITGSWRVDTTSDDDLMGFAFGFQNDQQFYLFDWKRADQNGHDTGITGLAQRGMTVKKVRAVTALDDLWRTGGTENVDILGHNTIPWSPNVDYGFKLEFYPPNIKITVTSGATVVGEFQIEDSTYSGGGFGFYNFSQEQLVYRGFTRSLFPATTYSYQVKAVDPDDDPLTYSIVSGPVGLQIEAATGLLTWAPGTDQVGANAVTIRVDDGKGGVAEQSFTIGIVATDSPPSAELTSTGSKINIGDSYSVKLVTSDDIGVASSFVTLNGATIPLDQDGIYTATATSKGRLFFSATVTDTSGQTATSRTTITVEDPNNPDVSGDGTVAGPGGGVGTGSGPAPLVEITAPNGSAGEDLGLFVGTVSGNGGTLTSWTLDYAPESQVNLNNLVDPAVTWAPIASSSDQKNREMLGTLDPSGLANTNYVFRLLAYNSNGRGAVTSVIFNPLDTSIPKIAFTSPTVGSEVSYVTEIRATINPDGGTIDHWILDYAQAAEVSLDLLSDPSVQWTELGRGNSAKTDAAIGTLDATMLRNDSYVLRIRAWNTNRRGYQLGGIFNVTGQSKLGNFRVEFTDLAIPLQGIPIQIKRVYDSLDAGRTKDFGYGWSLGLGDADIRETVPDTGGTIFTATPFKVGTRVYLTTPDGKRVGYTFKLRNPQSSFFFTTWEPYFEPDRGVYEKLTLGPKDQTRVSQTSNGSVVYPLLQFGFNPNYYRLTLQNGTVYHYSQQQGLLDITDTNGNVATFSKDGISHSGGASISFVRDAQGRITSINAPNSLTVGYAYDASGDLVTVTNQLEAATGFSYLADPAHFLEKISNPSDLAQGRYTQKVVYDANGRVSEVQDGDGNVFAKQSFDPGSFTGTRTDGRGNVTKLTYDNRGNLVREEKPEGGVTRYEYSDPANPDKETAIIDPLNNRRSLTYDSNGNKLTETDPLGVVTVYGYNSLGKITSLVRKNAAGVVLTSEAAEYDAAGNLTKLVNPLGFERQFAYDGARLIASTDFEGNLTQYDYTNGCPCGSPSKVTYADGTTKLFEYNAYGQVTKITDETGAVTRFVFDALGRKVQEIDHDGNATVFEYDNDNSLVKRTDRLGRIAKFEYNSRNLLEREIKILTNDADDTNDVIVRYEYDEDDRLAALTDPMGNRTVFAYDRDGRLSTRTDAAGKSSSVQYDLAGNTTTILDRNGRKRSFLYDSRNLPTAERWHAANDSITRTISIAYDDLGRRTAISDPDSAYAWTYDAASRVQTETNAGTPLLPLVSFTYGYDKDGHRTSVIDNAGVSVATGFDNRGRSDSFTWQGGGISPASVDLDRNGRGQMTAIRRHANASLSSLVSQTTFDDIAPQGWVRQIQHKNAGGALYNSGTNFTYGYDKEGQVTSQSSQGNSSIYSYDLTGQLTGADHSAAAYPDESYVYDKAGNRTSSHLHASYTTGVANRLQSDGQFKYSYDEEGNLVTKTEIATGKVTSYAYDYRARVTSLTERASAGGAITSQQSFTYDALDRRIGIVVNGAATRISYLDENAWADYNAAGVATKRYLFADRIDGNLASWTTTNGTQWYLTDKLGSIRGLASIGGAIGVNVGYDSFGNNLVGSGILATERFGFTGRENVAAGTMFYRSRFYDSGAGRFIGEDRIDFEGGDWNLYRYGYNSPHVFTDPSGSVSAFENAVLRFVRDQAIDLLLTYTICSIIEGKDDPLEEVLVGKGLGLVISAKFKAIGSTIAYSRQIGGGVGFVAKIVVCIAYD